MVVLDASAVIALLRDEPGAEFVRSKLGRAAMSAVNLQEVAKELGDQGLEPHEVAETLEGISLQVLPHDIEDALLSASLASVTRRFGRGLGDRTCMALAIRLGVPAVTTDKAWVQMEIPGLEVVLAR